ncbi:ABC transporter ATP-binding protein [Actinomycetes bacterium]|nr:ABC transporter ATP-binding protein [Actinomycetes bacterium]
MKLLEVISVTKKFGALTAVDKASIFINQNEIVGLIGPNGSGKSTLLHTVCGRTIATEGQILLQGLDITKQDPQDRAIAGMAIKFQLARIYLEKTVRENLLISLQAKESIWSQLRNRSLAKFEDKITSLADEFQLTEYLDEFAKSLSHGQQQWLEIAMAMASEPILLLLDEPTAGMSPKERADTAILIKKASKKCGVLIVEHDLDFIKEICDRISVLHQGNIIATGTSAEIEKDPKVKEVYLTRV